MAEAVGVAGSIIAISDLSVKLISYLNDVRSSGKEMQRIMVEVSTMKGLLGTIKDLVEVDESWIQTIKSLDQRPDGPLSQVHLLLEDLTRKLTPLQGLRKMGKAVVWPFKQEQVQRILSTLQRMNSIFALALQSDHVELSRAIRGELNELKQYVLNVHQDIQDNNGCNLVTDNTLSKILHWLSPLDPSVNHLAACSRHEPGTGNWLLGSDELRRWLDSTSSLLWIQGIAGSGKTVLCSTLIETIQTLQGSNKTNDEYLGYFYFDFNDDGKRSALGALRSIVAQIASCSAASRGNRLPSCVQQLHDDCKIRNQQPTMKQLLEVLKALSLSPGRMMVVMDALDECADHEELLGMISEIASLQSPTISMLVTSRKEHEIEEAFAPIQKDVVYVGSDLIEADIRLYISRRLVTDSRLRTRSAEIRKEIESALVERAHGMFRWVTCQLDALRSCLNAASLRNALKSLPKTLDEIYDRILGRIDENYQLQAFTALQWLTFSARPLTLSEVAEAVAIRPAVAEDSLDLENNRLFAPQDILIVCSSMVTYSVKSQEIRLAHHSVREYLISDRIRLHPVTKIYGISESLASKTIAEACLRYLLSFNTPESIRSTTAGEYPLIGYAAKYWPIHVRAIQETNVVEEVAQLSMRLLNVPSSKGTEFAFSNWLRIARPDKPWAGSSTQEEHTSEIASPLYYASFYGLDRVAILLLELGIDPNCKGLYGSCIHTAVFRGFADIITILLRNGADINLKHLGGTPLHRAAQGGSEVVMQALLEASPDVDGLDESGSTALHHAALAGAEGLVRLLLGKGARHDIRNAAEHSPLRLAAASGRLGCVKALVEWGADVMERTHKGFTLLHSVGNFPEVTSYLINAGVPVNAKDVHGQTALHSVWNVKTAKMLLENGADVNAASNRRHTPLHFATVDRDTEMASLLLDYGANINAQSDLGQSPLDRAKGTWNYVIDNFQQKRVEMIRYLISRGAKVGTGDKSTVDPSASQLVWAVQKQSFQTVRQLLDDGADINGRTAEGITALSVSMRCPTPEMTKLLLQRGADTELFDASGHTPLFQAAANGHNGHLLAMLQHGAEPNFICAHDETPLHLAAWEGHLESVTHLLKYKANPNTPVAGGRTVLHVACWQARTKIVKLLIDNGAEVDAKSDDGTTPMLEVVCFRGHLNTVKQDYVDTLRTLIDHGGDIEAQVFGGWTPLGRAVFNGNDGMVRLLLERGANPGAQSPDKKSLIDLAIEEGRNDVLKLLRRSSFEP